MSKRGKILLHTLVFIVLTALTQIGGVVYLMSFVFCGRIKYAFPLKGLAAFLIIYSLGTFVTAPMLAKLFDRERIEHYDNLHPANYMTIILNRNYVRPEVNTYLKTVSETLQETNPDVKMRYLDANFPLIDGFPMLPHLSHYDGKKIDLSLVYENEQGDIIDACKSVSGYGVFEGPRKGEVNQYKACITAGFSYYDAPKYMTLGSINEELRFSEKGTRALMDALTRPDEVDKVFMEPHLTQRLRLKNRKIRFQGCHSVRHDDHIHVQVR
ncbi:hypothetical protein KDU71_17795 [Carboxylicivirga sediminis]|uniref:Uncharacterized protein n=1 Tax=Carboxylicivirga sediminis TaxID=2006564 RepID=A0A941F5X9_9BACT|nr:hypothetical protein [Carboxylicivirga sediminis]MBR8537426.1 hypothetical protein [Carboxylicivirga sediminis]